MGYYSGGLLAYGLSQDSATTQALSGKDGIAYPDKILVVLALCIFTTGREIVAQATRGMDEISHRSVASGQSPLADEYEFCDISPLSK